MKADSLRPLSNRLSDIPEPLALQARPNRRSYAALARMVPPEKLSVVFQPIVHLHDASFFAYEALVRCALPEYSDPSRLFEHAVEAGCTGRLGRMIREVAVPMAAGSPLFINVHPQELRESWLVRPDDPIFFHDREVYLEITESVPFEHYETCIQVLSEIRTRGGIHLVVDDLGAGYSNLKRITDLAPAVVKLDRDLISGIVGNPRQRQLVQGVARLCDDLNARVVAEGIETREEYLAVRDSGVCYGQGYLFARPSFPPPPVEWVPMAPLRVPRID